MGSAHEFQDGLDGGATPGRGAGLNPGNRFESIRLHVLGEHYDRILLGDEEPGRPRTQVFRDHARSILNHITSPDLPFSWTMNPYRGCEHGCVYCYARQDHEYLGLSSGMDFETKIFAKLNAPDLLRKELARPKWAAEPIVLAGDTDVYQPIERRMALTRSVLEVMAECRQPVSIVTKNRLVTRDADLLGALAEDRAARVAISVTTLDNQLASSMEPRASSPSQRLDAIRALTDAGVPVVVMVAPIIPGLTDSEVPAILRAASEAGAIGAGYVMLRLPHQLKALVLDWLRRERPMRAARVEAAVREMRGGELYDPSFGARGKGQGPRAEQIRAMFQMFTSRFGLDRKLPPLSSASFRRPEADGQLHLF